MLEALFNKVAGLKETPTQVFPCEYFKIFKNSFFYRAPLLAASENSSILDVCWIPKYASAWLLSNKSETGYRQVNGIIDL